MTTTQPTVTVAQRLNAERIRRDQAPGTLMERALRKAQHVESRPWAYTEPMLRWAEDLILLTWNVEVPVSEWYVSAQRAEDAGWLQS